MRLRPIVVLILGCIVSFAAHAQAADPVTSLKQTADNAKGPEQVRASLHVARFQLQRVSDFYKAGDNDNARRALKDVETYGVRAADAAAKTNKYQKDCEIEVRNYSFRLGEIAKDADIDERPAIKAVIAKLDKAHDDLLNSMFKKK